MYNPVHNLHANHRNYRADSLVASHHADQLLIQVLSHLCCLLVNRRLSLADAHLDSRLLDQVHHHLLNHHAYRLLNLPSNQLVSLPPGLLDSPPEFLHQYRQLNLLLYPVNNLLVGHQHNPAISLLDDLRVNPVLSQFNALPVNPVLCRRLSHLDNHLNSLRLSPVPNLHHSLSLCRQVNRPVK